MERIVPAIDPVTVKRLAPEFILLMINFFDLFRVGSGSVSAKAPAAVFPKAVSIVFGIVDAAVKVCEVLITVVPELSFEITRLAIEVMAEIKSDIFDVVIDPTCWLLTEESAGVKLTVKSAAIAGEEIRAVRMRAESSFIMDPILLVFKSNNYLGPEHDHICAQSL